MGADIEPEQVDDCRRRFATVPNVTFCLVQELNGAEHTRSDGVVTCMETLEHCTDSTVDSVLADLDRLCTRDGTAVISVPIETGPVFVLKYLVRKLAVWRGLNEYAGYETYSWRDAGRMLFATERTVLHRPAYGIRGCPTTHTMASTGVGSARVSQTYSGSSGCSLRRSDCRADGSAVRSGCLPAAIAATRNADARFV